MTNQTLPSTLHFSIHGIYIVLALLTAATFSEWFEPFDGGGGAGAALLPVTVLFLLFFAFLGFVNSRIAMKKNWARIRSEEHTSELQSH